MPIETQQLIKDILFCLQSYIYWYDEFQSEETWSAQNNATHFYLRLSERLPMAIEYFRKNHTDSLSV